MHRHLDLTGRHIVFLSWRDTSNPEGGGAERYLEKMAEGLVARGARVTIFCARHDQAPASEEVGGIRFARHGSKMGVYAHGFWRLLTGRFGRLDAVVDVQNGLPFFSRLATRRPVVVLVHHVHREQWPVVYPGLTGRVGWWIESWFAPRLYRRTQYVAVSGATRQELGELGVSPDRVAVVHNGTDPALPVGVVKTPWPSICVVGRVVPHKRVEHAVDAWAQLRRTIPGLRLTVVGSGWWEDELRAYARRVDPAGDIEFTGHVSDQRKQEIYAASWVMALPSLKEGWGLVIGEAGMHATPTVAYRAAGGTTESIDDGRSGLLADTRDQFIAHLERVLTDEAVRSGLAKGARQMSHQFTWGHAQGSFAHVLASTWAGQIEDSQDPDEE